jgi:hypothetical protein
MYKILLTRDEYTLFKDTCQSESNAYFTSDINDKVEVAFNDDNSAEVCYELITDAYVYDGFDLEYRPTAKGILYEHIIDKFAAMW